MKRKQVLQARCHSPTSYKGSGCEAIADTTLKMHTEHESTFCQARCRARVAKRHIYISCAIAAASQKRVARACATEVAGRVAEAACNASVNTEPHRSQPPKWRSRPPQCGTRPGLRGGRPC